MEMIWRKSTRSGPWTDNCVEALSKIWKKATKSLGSDHCVEVSVGFKKSSFSTSGAQCVEVDVRDDEEFKNGEPIVVYVRDSTNPEGGTLGFTRPEWNAFVEGVKLGEFDLADENETIPELASA